MSRFVDNGDNTVTDTQTELIWSKNTVAIDVNHKAAEKAVEALGEGWRLPTIQELFALADHSRYSPAIDTDAFPDTENEWYWSSSETVWNTSAVWFVYFCDGYVGYNRRSRKACVRAVRSMPMTTGATQ